MRPVLAQTKGVGADVNSLEVLNEMRSSGGEVIGVCTPLATQRGSSRGIVHPAYAPLERTELSAAINDPEDPETFNLQVQIRTRDSGHQSPLVTTPTHCHTWSASSSGVWNQYNSGTNTPRIATPICAKREFVTATSSTDVLDEPLPLVVVHRALHGKCRFISFPSLPPYDPPPPPPPGSSFPLFIGQVRFETSTAELVWLFRRTSGASALTLEGRGSGCFILHLKSEAERSLVRQLHKRVLFDVGGVWFARNSEEVDSLCEHVALDGPYLSKRSKLPRDAMVVEDIKVGATDMTPCYPFFNSQVPSPLRHPADKNGWGRTSSTRSTPTMASFDSRPPSPTIAPLPSGKYPTSMHRAPPAADVPPGLW